MIMLLIHGDCLVEMDQIEDHSVDFIFVDLPYGTTACSWDILIPFEPLWKQFERIRKKISSVALFGTEPFSSLLRVSNLKEYKYDWVWDKITARGHLVVEHRPLQQTENISIFGNGPYYPIMIDRPPSKIVISQEYRKSEIYGGGDSKSLPKQYTQWYPKNLLSISNANSSHASFHPTQKPITLLEYLIQTYTQEGDIVLDCCMGSGSTGIACLNTKREFIGIEKDEKFFKIAENRINRYQFKEVKETEVGLLSLF